MTPEQAAYFWGEMQSRGQLDLASLLIFPRPSDFCVYWRERRMAPTVASTRRTRPEPFALVRQHKGYRSTGAAMSIPCISLGRVGLAVADNEGVSTSTHGLSEGTGIEHGPSLAHGAPAGACVPQSLWTNIGQVDPQVGSMQGLDIAALAFLTMVEQTKAAQEDLKALMDGVEKRKVAAPENCGGPPPP